MKIKFKIFVITIFLIIFSFSHVYAIDMFLTNNSIHTNSTEILTNNIVESEELNEMISNDLTSATNPTPTVTHTTTVTNNTLSISDIIDVILIAVCVVLIFLAIAILIRCK